MFILTTDWTGDSTVRLSRQSRLYFLRKLRSFQVCIKMLHIFYKSFVANAIFFAAICWGSSIRARDTEILHKVIKKAGSSRWLWREGCCRNC